MRPIPMRNRTFPNASSAESKKVIIPRQKKKMPRVGQLVSVDPAEGKKKKEIGGSWLFPRSDQKHQETYLQQ